MTTTTRPAPVHGTRACYLRGCRRPECVTANARYCKAYQLRVTTRGGPIRVPAGPAAARVRTWNGQGWSHRQIAQAAGCSGRVIHNLITAAVHTIHPDIAAGIAAARIDSVGEPAYGHIDPTGARRRVQALAAIGWPFTEVSRRSGLAANTGGRLMNRSIVVASTAAAISAAYTRISHLTPEEHGVHPWVATKTRRWARTQGWRDPLWWEDYGGLDDPAAPEREPEPGEQPRYAVIAEDALWLEPQGYTRQQIAARLGVQRAYLDQAISRYRRQAAS